jgi:hypothetical protein
MIEQISFDYKFYFNENNKNNLFFDVTYLSKAEHIV